MSPLTEPTRIILRKGWQPMDPDAAAYISAVETADGQALEEPVKIAIDNFVLGCKEDGIWDAIKACCILAGARTLDGALVPLVGAAPTNYNFVAGDYDRKTGLVGDGSTKWMDTNRSATADPLLNCHASTYVTSGTVGLASAGGTTVGAVVLFHGNPMGGRMRNDTFTLSSINGTPPSFLGLSRTLSTGFNARLSSTTQFLTANANNNPSIGNFATHRFALANYYTTRLAFYSIGEALDLALLDARVTDLINKFAEVIP